MNFMDAVDKSKIISVNNTGNKKKKKEQDGAFWDVVDSDKIISVDDIAPVRTTVKLDGETLATGLISGVSALATEQVFSGKTVSQKEDDDSLQFFKAASNFDDGYQFGDVTKTILGSAGDLGLQAVKGFGKLFEGLVDLGQYGIGGLHGLMGYDDFAEEAKTLAKHDIVDLLAQDADEFLDQYSVLGRTTEGVAQAGGQIAGIYLTGGLGAASGLGAAGTTALTTGTMGLSTMGSSMGEAYNAGATDEEALTYGLISGTSAAATELIFGGLGKGINAMGFSKGLSSADDILAKTISSKFESQIAKNMVEFGIKAGAEGTEEVLDGLLNSIGKKLTYMSEEELSEIIADENLLEQFVIGTVSSGFAQSGFVPGTKSGSLIEANKTGTDFITGYNQNEQSVIKKETENRIAELEADGNKLSNKEKSAIEAQVEEDLKKGYISTDTIEEVLGGDTFKSYKDTMDSEDAIWQEFNTLNQMKQGEMTGEQIDRRTELKQQLEDIKNNSQRNQLKQQLSEEVFGIAKDSRLAESYNEKARRSQQYEADLTQYDAKQQAVIQKAIDSGILNNTNRTHEFVDMIAKISADKGVLFDFTNNEKLKESGFAVDGKTVNGYVTTDGVTLNIQSAKSLNSVVGHEITHVLEGTELYNELQKSIVEYAQGKGDYQGRYDAIARMYKNVKDANIDAELTADLVGDYLFTDSDFINSLSTKNRNLFQKIYDEVKYLFKVATAGSKEARQLEKVKKAFDKAYRESGKVSGDTKYHISEVFSEEIDKALNGSMSENSQIKARDYTPQILVDNGVSDLPMLITQRHVKSSIYTEAEAKALGLKTGGNNHYHGLGKNLFMQAVDGMDNPVALYKQDSDHYLFITEATDSNGNTVIVPVKVDGKGNYNDVYIDENQISSVYGRKNLANYLARNNFEKVYEKRGAALNPGVQFPDISSSSSDNVTQNQQNVKTQYSLSAVDAVLPTSDKWSRTLTTEEAKARFPKLWDVTADESEVRNPTQISSTVKSYRKVYDFLKAEGFNGNILDASSGLGYGTKAGIEEYGFNVEDIEPYPDKSYSPKYTDYSTLDKKYDAIISNAVLNVLPQDQRDALVVKMGDMLNDGGRIFINVRGKDVDSLATNKNNTNISPMEWFVDSTGSYQKGFTKPELVAYLQDALGDDFTVKPTNMFGAVSAIVTKNQGVKYSLSDSDGKQLSDGQQEYFKDSKVRDENGNLKVMYHGSQDAGFHTFKQEFSDDDTSFFFVDRNDVASTYSGTSETYEARTIRTIGDFVNFLTEIGESDYEVTGNEESGYFVLDVDGDTVAGSDNLGDLYEEFCDYMGIGYGDANYKVYLNLTNPLVVDAGGRNWNRISGEFSQEIYDRIQTLTAEEKTALTQLAAWEDSSIFRDELQTAVESVERGANYVDEHIRNLASAAEKLGDTDMYRLFDIASDNFSEESLRENAVKYLNTREYAQRAKEQGYDGVIFNNIVDNGGYASGNEGASTVAIAFDSKQIKSVANENPTGDADIRYSLSDSHGKQLSNEQVEYFKDSKIRDENGNLKAVYHGTPNGDFSVFNAGTYFTESKEYADVYQSPGASSISAGKNATNPKTFEVYLNIKKPFDIADEAARKIYINDYIKGGNALGINPYLSDAEYNKIDAIDWTEGEDLRDFLVENGYDYDGLVLDEGAVGGYGDDVKSRGKSYVIFSPDQAKNADNLKPTSDPDIRFSLSEPVEQTNELIALHNLKSSELLKSLELGGLPSPSIAVIKAQQGHDKYGEVSLIFPKEAIDPKANRDNKVYGGDAWTPTYPKIEYKPNSAVEKRVSNKYYELAKTIGYDNAKPLYRYVYEMEDSLNREGGEAGLLERLYADTDMMQVYLQDSGKEKVQPVVKETVAEISEAEAEMNQFMGDALGADMLSEFAVKPGENPMQHRKAFIEQHEDAIRDAYGRLCKEVYGFTDAETNNVLEQTGRKDLMRFIRNAYMFTKNNGVTVKTETDYAATKEAIRNAAQEGYREWVDNLFGGVEETSGIRNNASYYTPSGNPRNWNALHYENTLENVVKVMKQQEQTGADAMFGVNQLFSAAAKDYGSIADIKADSDRLYTQNAEEYEAAKESYVARFSEIAGKIMDKQNSNAFIAQENAMECIVDAVRSYKTAAGIFKDLKQYPQLTVTQNDVADIISLVRDISNMPTGYFEAKPMRAVGFDEVGVFVIPNDADVKLKQELLNKGYSIAEYDPNVEGDRQRVVNQFEQYKFSLSEVGTQKHPDNKQMEYAPVAETIPAKQSTVSKTENVAPVVTEEAYPVDNDLFPDDLAPVDAELENLYDKKAEIEVKLAPFTAMPESEWEAHRDEITESVTEYSAVMNRITELEAEAKTADTDRLDSLVNEEAPPEAEAPCYGNDRVNVENPFDDREWGEVGNRKVKAYMYENPEVKPFFQEEAYALLMELNDTTKGERWYNDEVYYESGGEKGFGGTKRHTSQSMEILLDSWGMSYADIEKGLNAIIEDHGAENIAAAKKVEFMLNDRLLNGYKDFYSNGYVEPNQEYIKLLEEKQIGEYSTEAFDKFMETADQYAPIDDSVIPVNETAQAEEIAPVSEAPVEESHPAEVARKAEEKKAKTAEIIVGEPKSGKKKSRLGMMLRKNFVDDYSVFEDLAIKHKNRELQGKASFMRSAEGRAQWMIGEGTQGVKSLKDIKTEVDATGKTKAFYEYLYHVHNIDRMSLETEDNRTKREALQERFKGYTDKQVNDIAKEWIKHNTPDDVKERIKAARAYIEAKQGANKPVFGYEVTADVSREAVKKYEAANPEFKGFAKDVYKYMNHLRSLLVENDVISKETAELWEKMYPHYVPIRRDTETGLNINVPLDSRKTGVNTPVKRAKGGNSDILDLFDTMAMRTEQTFRAIARNNFGLELKDTLGTVIGSEEVANGIDETFEGMDAHEELLQKGKDGQNPTFTVFENGKRVTFEITEDMYDALKPKSEGLSYKNKLLGKLTDVQRGLLTQYSPMFIVKNALKDPQDAILNSQHPLKTAKNFPLAYKEILGKGSWWREYVENGGEHNTYFDRSKNTFTEDVNGVKKVITMPLKAIDAVGGVIEMAPRLAEYMASRKDGRSIEVSMLDAARVTTDFSAGGDVTKFLNRNGATFLNASVQGASQYVRNIREANAQGFAGWAKLATKTAIVGLPALILNNLLWDDDEEYEELSDYVKRDYYIVGKTDDGQFIRIPKGRAVSVIQNAFEQMSNVATGDDEADLGAFLELFISNLAPNNPLDNNVFAPLIQTFGTEKTWYGEDLIPSRLQDLPAAEQYDESTDSISKWLGEKLNVSPYKLNYLLNQYSGGVGDVVLPMLTPEAEGGDDSLLGNLIAPMKDVFTTDSVLNNQNVSDFYDTKDQITVNANSSKATEEDAMKELYFDAVGWEMSDLYKQKREIQSSDLSDSEKYEQVREIQEQINTLARDALSGYNNVSIDGMYSEVGNKRFNYDQENGKWYEIREKNSDGTDNYWYQKEQEVTNGLGISYSQYWNNREEYDYAYDKPEQYAVAQACGGYKDFTAYQSDLWDIKADKDENGKSITGSRKEKVIDYINDMDADYGTKIILFKNEYNADDTYNYEIIDYLNSRDDISYEQMETILKYLGFEVDKNGNISW